MPIHQLGRYEIIGELGRGAMGIVYKARDPLIERIVAIKCVGIGMSQEETEAFEQRFYREAKSAGRLNHPNIVTIYDVGKSGEHAYIAMECLEGQSLREILDSGVVLPLDLIADVIAQVADGLAFAHQNAIVHRDIKPANIMVLYNGAVKVTDFGIALLPTGSRTMTGTIFGSPKYVSPEQVVGNQVDGRSDIFSLGAVLYETLTGAPPFSGDELNAILYKVINEMPPPPSERNRRIPSALDYIALKAMAKLPSERYQTIQELAADLRNYAQLTPPTTSLTTKTLERRAVRRPHEVIVQPVVTVVATPRTTSAPKIPRTLEGGASQLSQGEATIRIDPAANDAMQADGRPDIPGSKGRKRQKLVIYGIPILLSAIFGTWLLLPGQNSIPEPNSERRTGAISNTPQPSASKGEETSSEGKISSKVVPPATSSNIGNIGEAPAPNSSPQSLPQNADGAAPETNNVTTAPSPPTQPDSQEKVSKKKSPGALSTSPQKGKASETARAPSGAGDKIKAAEKATATVAFAVTPWGEIYINGQREGISPPLKELNLPPGKHIIEIRNTAFPPYRETIELKPESSAKVKHKFQ